MELNVSALDMLPTTEEAGLMYCDMTCFDVSVNCGGSTMNTQTVTTTGGWY
ncbi:ALQxL family class IV lanthipeptide [Nonomuraea spiralis]|uniref:ALQxL family class IV lanthipeptide n=1 Tax=Nonomuraea spiralis TaxID=46182 RepID=A0ABV5IWH6_9ACTN|nr:ALQxL family class IV lanthipeptide [Nonomuraea spiralis]GGS90190.1 hypothetical protein GCM10010176_037460 [Nonomuraea spiralis]